MERSELNSLEKWFSEYCRSFYTQDRDDQKNIILKEVHTQNVVANMAKIGRSLGMDGSDAAVAEAIALLHDVGRFPQFARYRTFRDSISTNHAALGASVLLEQNVLGRLPEDERRLIVHAVALHNVFAIPEGLDERTLFFVKMVRDADKLDIWRVFIEYFSQDSADRPSATGLGLPEGDGYSPQVLAAVTRGEMVQLSSLTSLNDFKLLQLGWTFDLNFDRSLELLLDRGYIEGLAAMLPDAADIRAAVELVREHVSRRLRAR